MAHETEREALKSVYRNPTWIKKVNGWSDDQVIAVYLRLKRQNVL